MGWEIINKDKKKCGCYTEVSIYESKKMWSEITTIKKDLTFKPFIPSGYGPEPESFSVYGIFANNTNGKSSILDAFMFCIFDKCSRTTKASDVLNNKKNSFKSKLKLELNNKIYFIERNGKKDKYGHVKIFVDFYYFDDNGEKVSLNGTERDSTNTNIRLYLGTYDDFVLTSLSSQNN